MTEKKDERSFNRRLMDAMAEMVNPTKGKTAKVPTKSGKEYSYQYESLDQVLDIVDPALHNHGLCQTQRQSWNDQCNSFVLQTLVFDDNEERIMDVRPLPSQPDAQKSGSYETYMRRYALKTVFGLAGEDDDGAATKTQNYTANRNTAIDKDIAYGLNGADDLTASDLMKKAKVTEMASTALMSKLDAKILELAELKEKTIEEVKQALMDSKTMKGVKTYTAMTKEEANNALCLLIKWVNDASSVDYADNDINF